VDGIDFVKLEEFLPKGTNKYCVSIRDNGVWETIKLDNVIHEKLSYGRCCVWMFNCLKMSKFGKSIHYYHDHTVAIGFRQAFYEIHRYVHPHFASIAVGSD